MGENEEYVSLTDVFRQRIMQRTGHLDSGTVNQISDLISSKFDKDKISLINIVETISGLILFATNLPYVFSEVYGPDVMERSIANKNPPQTIMKSILDNTINMYTNKTYQQIKNFVLDNINPGADIILDGIKYMDPFDDLDFEGRAKQLLKKYDKLKSMNYIDLRKIFSDILKNSLKGDNVTFEFKTKALDGIIKAIGQDKIILNGDPADILKNLYNFTNQIVPAYEKLVGKGVYESLYGYINPEKENSLIGPKALAHNLETAISEVSATLCSGQNLNDGYFNEKVKDKVMLTCNEVVNGIRQRAYLQNPDISPQNALKIGLCYIINH